MEKRKISRELWFTASVLFLFFLINSFVLFWPERVYITDFTYGNAVESEPAMVSVAFQKIK